MLFFVLPLEGVGFFESDYSEGRKKAAQAHKTMLLVFTGSDWSEGSKVMMERVLNWPRVQERLAPHFVVYLADFPLTHPLPSEVAVTNGRLKEELAIEGYPTLVLQYQAAKVVINGDFTTDPDRFVSHLIQEKEKMASFYNTMAHFDKMTFNQEQIEKLYRQANKMGLVEEKKQILKRGIATNRPLFFLKEHYRQLCQEEASFEERQAIRKKLSAWMSKEDEASFSALTEFQSHLLHGETEKATEVLDHYLEAFDGPSKAHIQALRQSLHADSTH